MKNILLTITLLSALLVSTFSQATLLSIKLNGSDFQVGDVLSADLIISDIEMEDGFKKLLATFEFDLNFNFNSDIIKFTSMNFGNQLDVDPSFLSFQNFDEFSSGMLKISEDSFADSIDLFTAQGGLSQFILASINFTVISVGSDTFSLTNVVFGDDHGNDFNSISSTVQTYTAASSVSVPEPTSILLMVFAFMLLLRHQRV